MLVNSVPHTMRAITLNPREILYTEEPSDLETFRKILGIFDELRKGHRIKLPVYVIKLPEFGNRLAIFNGNKRTQAAEWRKIPILALEIQTQADFQEAQRQQPTYWHKIEDEDFLRFNGEYFCKDFDEMRKRGLLASAYCRAKIRIKEAVRRRYSLI